MTSKYEFWKNIWDVKGNSDNTDLLYLDGYDHLPAKFSSWDIAKQIRDQLKIRDEEYVLEVGCGAGFLGREFSRFCLYSGIDYSAGLIEKHRRMFKNQVFVCEAGDLFYPDKSFDYVFAYGVFQYFPNKKYAKKVVSEMLRVAKRSIFVGDLKTIKTNDKHLCYEPYEFRDMFLGEFLTKYETTPCLHDKNTTERFNVIMSPA